MTIDIEDIQYQVESFGHEFTDEDKRIVEKCEDLEALYEWNEKVEGNLWMANRLYPLPQEMPKPAEPEWIADWRDWTNFEPHDPPTFTCPLCDEEHYEVELDSGNYQALNEMGDLVGYEFIHESNNSIYNYGLEENPDSEYTKLCGYCRDELTSKGGFSGFWGEQILYHDSSSHAKVNASSHIAHRPPEYWNLSEKSRNVIDQFIQYNESETDFVKIDYPDCRPSQKSNVAQWIGGWAAYPEQHDYHFDFPTIIKVELRGYNYGSRKLYVPDRPDAIEEATEWLENAADKNDWRSGR